LEDYMAKSKKMVADELEGQRKIIAGSKSKIPLLQPGYCRVWLGRSYS
jgi:hypothetical protein